MKNEPLVQLDVDERSLAEADRILRGIPGGAQRVMARALTRAATSARTQLSRSVSRRLGVRVKDVRSRMGVRRANRNSLRSALDVSSDRTQLIALHAEQTPLGVTYKPFGRGDRMLLRHAFIAKGPKRGMQVWLRSEHQLGRKKYIVHRGREMEALYLQKGASLLDVLDPGDIQSVAAGASRDLPRNIEDQMGVELRRWESRGRR
jgi:hypothetical protein